MSSLPPVRIAHPHVFVDADGSPLISGSRVPVRRLFSWHRGGTSVETLLRRYPQLGPARILDALAFAYDNLELVSTDLARERDALAREQTTALEPPPLSPKQRAEAAKSRQEKLPFKK